MKNHIIVVQIKGGLGNQMFQYALGRRLALDRNIPIKLDLSWFDDQRKRKYELDQLNIKAEIASKKDLETFPPFSRNRLIRGLYNRISKRFPNYAGGVFREKEFGTFDPLLLKVNEHKYLEGYWQSEKYFKFIETQIREDFTLKQPLSSGDQALANEMYENPYSVSVHIRRGDYVSDNQTIQAHYICTPDYFRETMIEINEKLKRKAKFYVFSDDPDWCLTGVEYPSKFKIVSILERSTSHELFLMSKCRNAIMANSSFSWWGAWLTPDTDKIVYYPKNWLNNKNTPDIALNSWLAFQHTTGNNRMHINIP